VDSAARRHFRRLIERPDAEIDLGQASLAIAAEEYPHLDPEAYARRIDDFGERVARAATRSGEVTRLAALIDLLGNVEGFDGNRSAYHDPRNSFLNEVLDRRVGIPLSLSLVYVLVGRRASLRMSGVAFPGHFLARCDLEDGFVIVDGYGGGRQLSLEDCKRLLNSSQRDAPFDDASLEPASNRAILFRSLANLKAAYLRRGDLVRTLLALDRMLLLAPDHPGVWRDRGLLHLELGRFPRALSDLDRYQELDPERAVADSPVLAASALMRGKSRFLN
jgi:regulator of sirC expression with transglutaminase-like and TPR domain